jgi:hypothetical protein
MSKEKATWRCWNKNETLTEKTTQQTVKAQSAQDQKAKKEEGGGQKFSMVAAKKT